MPGPHTWGRDGVGSSEGGKRFPFLRASLFSLSFLVSLSNPYSSFYLFVFFVGFFFYVIMPVMSMRMTCRVRSIKVKGLRSPRSPNECLDGGLEGRNATSLLVLS
jgi:hypothetical protein